MASASDLWWKYAPQWDLLGPPLRPSRADAEFQEHIVQRHGAEHGPPRAVLLGVTPEIARMGWPTGTELIAVDRSPLMLEHVWPGFPNPGDGAVLSDWLELSLEPSSRDIVISDGCFATVRYPDQTRLLFRRIHDMLSPSGLLVFRMFCRPEESETPQTVFEDALSGRIDRYDAFKMRLLMAIQPDTKSGVCTADVWNYWDALSPGAEAFAERCNWPFEKVALIEAYKGQKTFYYFPTLAELRDLWLEAQYEEVLCESLDYELGERCPHIALSPKKAG